MLPFWVSIGGLSLAQGATVLLPAARHLPLAGRLRSRWWAIAPAVSVGAAVAGVSATGQTADGLTYLALGGVPLLAALALGWAMRHSRGALALGVVPLFGLAWAVPASLAGQGSGLALGAFSCVALGVLLAAVAPPGWLKLGIVAMAALDAGLVAADLLQAPNRVLSAAAPGAGLPQLQSVAFGSAQMGYGDLFIAAALGALLAADRPTQRRAAVLTAAFALAFDLLFLAVPELPATVPIALALIAIELSAHGRRRRANRLTQTPGHALAAPRGQAFSAAGRGRGDP